MTGDFTSFIFLTCRTPDAILGRIFRLMWFMVLHICRVFDDRWFHATRSSTYHTSDAILGHISISIEIYGSSWSCMLILICETYAEMTIYSLSSRWFLSGAYREPSRQAHAFRCLDVDMLSSEGRLFYMWDWFSCRHRWFEFIWFFDMLHSRCHTGSYSPSWSRFIDPHWFTWLSTVMGYTPGRCLTSFCPDTPRSLSWVTQPDSLI